MGFAFLFVDAGQSKCRLERAQALEQAKKPQEAVFIPECNEDGSFMQVKFLFASFTRLQVSVGDSVLRHESSDDSRVGAHTDSVTQVKI